MATYGPSNLPSGILNVGDSIVYTSANWTRIILYPGYYRLRCWGAQGGSYGGKGGYIQTDITVRHPDVFYIIAGAQGKSGSGTTAASGGYPGGGNSASDASGSHAAGGGYSAITYRRASLYAAIIVGGGGGGAVSSSYSSGTAGGGGYPSGLKGGGSGGYGGSATGGGARADGSSSYIQSATAGSFGNGGSYSGTATGTTMGGGAGWYGGGACLENGCGGGGSSYVFRADRWRQAIYNSLVPMEYASDPSKISYSNGMWTGNGRVEIDMINQLSSPHQIVIKENGSWTTYGKGECC